MYMHKNIDAAAAAIVGKDAMRVVARWHAGFLVLLGKVFHKEVETHCPCTGSKANSVVVDFCLFLLMYGVKGIISSDYRTERKLQII
jgi:hypothetical protein